MSNYNGFAYVYDLLMKDVPYPAWASYIDRVITQHLGDNRKGKIVLDMACGTGNITFPLAKMGYDMIGIDISTDMLSQALAKKEDEEILFLAQDMLNLDLYGTIDAAVCACDGLNYILEIPQLEEVFKRVKMFLNPGGVFIFDINTEYKFENILGQQSFYSDNTDDNTDNEGTAYEWNNSFDKDTGINTYHVHFMPKGSDPFIEIHHQRAYPADVICGLLQNAGFKSIEKRDGYTDALPDDKTSRITFICL
ncbi:MAG: class I SAM-dependent methyltransferase [Defluviitaleaceae bacterium]|nr:class I SAM-dependent methyltransferase [Defluviitaleaceae bacterium]